MHVKLHPGVVYSHSGAKVCLPPKLYAAWVSNNDACLSSSSGGVGCSSLLYLTFYLAQGTSEWRYPFDLCASIYRVADILKLVQLTTATNDSGSSLANPNKLEFTGNKLFWESSELRGKYFKCACSAVPLACVVTVNKVQTTYDVPIYQNSMGDVDRLNRLLHCQVKNSDAGVEVVDRVAFDYERYRLLNNLSVHIGDILLTTSKSRGVPRQLTVSQVSSNFISFIVSSANSSGGVGVCLAACVQWCLIFESVSVEPHRHPSRMHL